MKKQIFYSWQSRLPNKDNRNFIESCLKKAIKNYASSDISITYSLDKDTLNEYGSPDIPNTILKKIDNAMYFVADVSIVGNEAPNSNVLLELGYAIAKLGWERIICVFNLKYGEIEQLPFDLKFHRILTYHSDRTNDKAKITEIIITTIKNSQYLVEDQISIDILNKQKLDKQLIYIMNSLVSIYGFNKYQFDSLANANSNDLSEKLIRRKILGFYVFKNFDDVIVELEKLSISTSSFFSQRNIRATITNLIYSLKSFEYFRSKRQTPKLFVDTQEKDEKYEVIHGSKLHKDNRDGYILLEKYDIHQYKVIDFGNLLGRKQVELSTNYFIFNREYIEPFVGNTIDIVSIIEAYLVQFDGTFDIDLMKDFDMKKKEGIERLNYNRKNKFSLSTDQKIDLNFLKNFPYDDIVSYNFFFNLLRIGIVFNNHKDITFNIKTFFCNEYNLSYNVFKIANYDIITKKEYENFIEKNEYFIENIILPNSSLHFFQNKEACVNNKYMNDIYSKISFNLFELLPSLIEEEIKKNYFNYLEKNNELINGLNSIKKIFYTNFKSIESELLLFKLYLSEQMLINKE